MVQIALVAHVLGVDLDDPPRDATGLGVPADVIAHLEPLRHGSPSPPTAPDSTAGRSLHRILARAPWRSAANRASLAEPSSQRSLVMKFGLYSSIANPPSGEHLEHAIDEVIPGARPAQGGGFQFCLLRQQHQDTEGFPPPPLIVATAVAAHTRRL